MNAAKFVTRLRTSLAMTQDAFAKHIGVSRRTVIRWENGEAIPELTFQFLKTLASAPKRRGKR